MIDKVLSPDEVAGELRSGMVTDLTVASFGGPGVGLLIAAGRVRRVVCGLVSLDSIALEPHFRLAARPARLSSPSWTRA